MAGTAGNTRREFQLWLDRRNQAEVSELAALTVRKVFLSFEKMLIFLNLVSLAVTVTSGLPQRDALPCFVREEGSKEPAYCQVPNL
jgi:hypothetical protein